MRSSSTDFLLRTAIAFTFLYPAVDAVLHPDAWIGFFPQFIFAFVPGSLALPVWSLAEAVLALWIFSGKRIFLPSLAATIALVLIVLFNLPLMEIVFRDIALACVAAVLAMKSFGRGSA